MNIKDDILDNEHFQRLAALIRVPFGSAAWRAARKELPFWTLWNDFDKVTKPDVGKLNKPQVIERFTALITRIVEADPHLRYDESDVEWFVSILDGDQQRALAILNMLKAYASARDRVVSTNQLAAATATDDSTWRKRCIAGEIPGARKLGKTWLMPVAVLKYILAVDLGSLEEPTD